MKICLDTNAYSAFKRNNKRVVSIIEEADEILVPSIVLGELYFGFYKGTKSLNNIDELDQFMKLPGVFEQIVNRSVAEKYGIILKELLEKGKPIPTNDIWIAATALETSSKLLSMDKHFKHIPTLIQLEF